ncbi:MAG: DegT/DnrJ/EryC1/StrS aminotransferase family protein [Elusimicrobia bacterium]|nr:DegT/DnrJ/EryC1/StrS aminotransferase family protein [Elusimicrobiota bacterium]
MWKLQENILEKSDKDKLSDFIASTDRFTQFNMVKLFEKEWSKWQGCKYSVFVNSGSSADLLMLDAVKEHHALPDNCEVLVPAVTWTTNVTSVIQAKMKPVFVDINLDDLAFDYAGLEKAVTPETKIILITHLLGLPANMAKVKAIAEKRGLIVLEDCCESHGARAEGRKVGNHGAASTFSFYWGHHMTTIEGGMLCTDSEELNDLFLLKRSHGLARELDPSKHDFYRKKYPEVSFDFLFLTHGYNFRNTELHATIGIEQLKHLDRYIGIRNGNHRKYSEIISPLGDKVYRFAAEGISSFCLPFIFRDRKDMELLRGKCREAQIETRPIVGANLLRQPCFRAYGDYRDFHNAEILHLNGFYIGNNQFVDDERLNKLKEVIKDSFEAGVR